MTKKEYEKYLQTEHWKAVSKYLKDKYKKCQMCGNSKKLNVHHNNYECLYAETDKDLIVLCNKCHETFHNKLDRKIRKCDIEKEAWSLRSINKTKGVFYVMRLICDKIKVIDVSELKEKLTILYEKYDVLPNKNLKQSGAKFDCYDHFADGHLFGYHFKEKYPFFAVESVSVEDCSCLLLSWSLLCHWLIDHRMYSQNEHYKRDIDSLLSLIDSLKERLENEQ